MRLMAAALLLSPLAISQQQIVVPSTYATADAPSFLWVAGSSGELRQQTLIGASHLGALAGHQLTALEFRRQAVNEAYSGGTANVTLTLSTAPAAPTHASRLFLDNLGADAVQVFQGTVTIPASPGVTGQAAWTASNTIRIQFTTPFAYSGGTLCVDLVGSATVGQQAGWWMADAAFEDLHGSSAEIANGCGAYGGPAGKWGYVDSYSLVPGGNAHFEAQGPAWNAGFMMLSLAAGTPFPVYLLGLPAAPECTLQVDLANMVLTDACLFTPSTFAGIDPALGFADLYVGVPPNPTMMGLSASVQWLSYPDFSTSNGLLFTIANGMPSLDMSVVQGHPLDADGQVSLQRAHVVRFDYQ